MSPANPLVPISVIVLTRNEERNIRECLRSVDWSDDIVVVDSGSTDRTVDLARLHTPKVIASEWLGYAETKSLAVTHTVHDWVLWLDADERVMPGLAAEIKQVVERDRAGERGYEVARRAYFLGKWIRHCGWYPGYVVRLFRKDSARFVATRVHERLEISGPVGRLNGDLLHYTDATLGQYLAKFNRYTTLAAEDLADKGRDASLYDLVVRPPYMLLKMYVLRLGFLDGMHGLVLSLLSSAYVFWKYAKLWDLRRAQRERGEHSGHAGRPESGVKSVR